MTNQGKEISNQGKDYRSGQERLQTEAGITNRCRTQVILLNKSESLSVLTTMLYVTATYAACSL